jgi:hypothetical protein
MRARQTDPDIATLAKLIGALVPYDGTVELPVPGVRAARVSRPNQEPMHYLQRSSLCIVAQGAKIVTIGDETYGYEAGQMALYSIDVPMAGRVTRASYPEPYLVLIIDLDAEKLAELAVRVFPHGLPKPRHSRTLCRGRRHAHHRCGDEVARSDGPAGRSRAPRTARARRDSDSAAPKPDGEPSRSDRSVRFECAASRESCVVAAGEFRPACEHRRTGEAGEHERYVVSPAIQGRHGHEPSAIPENTQAPGSAAAHAGRDARRRTGESPRRLLERFTVHSRVRPLLRACADERHRSLTRTDRCCGRRLNRGPRLQAESRAAGQSK